MRAAIIALVSAASSCGMVRPAFALGSATTVFESVVLAYHAESKECHKPRRVLREATQRTLASAISEACDLVWPCQPERADWMFALKLTETNVGPSSTLTGAREKTHGPFCITVFEAREAARVLRVPLPRTADDVAKTLRDDYAVSALLAAWTLNVYEHQMRDRILGMLAYKYGPRGLARALEAAGTRPPTDLIPWQRFAQKLSEIKCVRARVEMGAPATCGCLP